VLEGRYEVTVGDERFEAADGTFIFAPRNVPHGLRRQVVSGQASGARGPQRV
jgi:quercetin dioxygenase-like cupin family protein